MRERLVDSHVRVRMDGAPRLEVERELEPLALGERRVRDPDPQPSAAEPLDAAARALEEGDEVAGAPGVVELDLHGPLRNRHRPARWRLAHRGRRAFRAKLAVGGVRPPRWNGKGAAGGRTGPLVLAGASVALLAVGSTVALARLGAADRIVGTSFSVVFVLVVAYAAALAHRRAVEAAVARERVRIARELHDGVAQELAFVVTQCSRLASEPRIRGIADAAQSALAESRRAMAALRRPVDAPLAEELELVARHAADRAGLRLELRLADGIELPSPARVELVRILHEAIVNTARHAQATSVLVELSCEHGTRLTISDDGVGFDTNQSPAVFSGFGIAGMRERANLFGGELRIMSAPLHGTRVEVQLP